MGFLSNREFFFPKEKGDAVWPISEWHFFHLLYKECATQGFYGSVPVTVKETFTN